MSRFGKILLDFSLPPISDENRGRIAALSVNLARPPSTLQDELAFNVDEMRQLVEDRINAASLLQPSQIAVFKRVMAAVRNNVRLVVFLDAPGGYGKTYLENTLLAAVRSLEVEYPIALAVATSGIAATLLKGGRTFHSRFKAPLKIKCGDMLNISSQSDEAMLIKKGQANSLGRSSHGAQIPSGSIRQDFERLDELRCTFRRQGVATRRRLQTSSSSCETWITSADCQCLSEVFSNLAAY